MCLQHYANIFTSFTVNFEIREACYEIHSYIRTAFYWFYLYSIADFIFIVHSCTSLYFRN